MATKKGGERVAQSALGRQGDKTDVQDERRTSREKEQICLGEETESKKRERKKSAAALADDAKCRTSFAEKQKPAQEKAGDDRRKTQLERECSMETNLSTFLHPKNSTFLKRREEKDRHTDVR